MWGYRGGSRIASWAQQVVRAGIACAAVPYPDTGVETIHW